jgi:hypothetical protein
MPAIPESEGRQPLVAPKHNEGGSTLNYLQLSTTSVPNFQIRLHKNDDDKSSKQVKVRTARKVTINKVTTQRTLTESCNIMKRFNSIVFALTAVCGFALSSYAQTDTILVNDTWADGNRTSTGPDGSGIDSQWFSSSGAALTVVPTAGPMRATIGAASLSEETYFASQTLAATGDELKFTWVYTPSTIAANTSQGFNLAVVNGATHVSADGSSPISQVYAGYAMYMNMAAPTFGNANAFALKEWNQGATAAALLSASGNWSTLLNGATLGNHGYDSGTTYTLVMTLTRNASSGLDITTTTTGGTVNGTGTETVSFTDTTPNTFTYDTFALRQTGSASGAAQVDTSLFKVEFLTAPVPEPTTLALAGLGILAFAGYRRMRR